MTAKDIAVLVRSGTPEPEIFAEIAKRRLNSPVDAAFVETVKASGGTEAFIARLRSGDYSLSPAAAAALQKRAGLLQKEAAEDEARRAALRAEALRKSPTAGGPNVAELIGSRLVTFDGSQLRPYDAERLRNVRIYAFYSSAGWCGPCRKFTPKLVAFYKVLKAAHPEFEIIFLSSDRDAFNMQAYMQSAKMPWPAVKYEQRDQSLQQFSSRSIPFLRVVDDRGNPVLAEDQGSPEGRSADQVLHDLTKALM